MKNRTNCLEIIIHRSDLNNKLNFNQRAKISKHKTNRFKTCIQNSVNLFVCNIKIINTP